MLLAYGLIKISIIYFCRRLFVVGKSGAFNLVTNVAVVVVLLWMIAFLGLFIFNCGSAVDAHWGSLIEVTKSCKFSFTAEEGMASSDLILDLFVFLLPFSVVSLPRCLQSAINDPRSDLETADDNSPQGRRFRCLLNWSCVSCSLTSHLEIMC